MVQLRQQLGFLDEPLADLLELVGGKALGLHGQRVAVAAAAVGQQFFHCHGAVERGIVGEVGNREAALSERLFDAIASALQERACGQRMRAAERPCCGLHVLRYNTSNSLVFMLLAGIICDTAKCECAMWARYWMFWLLVCILGLLPSCRAPQQEQAMEPSQLAAAAKPAVALVRVEHKAVVSIPKPEFNEARLERVARRFIISRGIVYEWELYARANEFVRYVMNDLVNNFSEYLRPAGSETKGYTLVSIGSGYFVSEDGYLVTSAHVVAPNTAEIRAWVADTYLRAEVDKLARQLADAFAQNLRASGYRLSNSERERLRLQALRFFRTHAKVTKVETRAPKVLMGYQTAGGPAPAKPIGAEVVVKGGAIPKKDVALLKVSGQNFFTLPLRESEPLQAGEPIYVLGYPGAATFAKVFEESSQQEPTLTAGLVSAKRMLKEGWEAVQIDASIQPGNSGGPVLDKQGRVVGIAAFQVGDTEGSERANFIVPIGVVREFLQRANVNPAESMASQLYREALHDVERQHYKAALEKLEQVEALRAGVPAVYELRQRAQLGILEGRDRTPHPYRWAFLAGGMGALTLFVGAGVVVAQRRRPKPVAPALPSAPHLLTLSPADPPTQMQTDPPTVVGSALPQFQLTLLNSAGTSRTVLVPTTGLTIGRSADNALVIDDPLVSRHHARLAYELGELVVYDLGSTNGTSVNGYRIMRQALKAGDVVQIGDTRLQVESTHIGSTSAGA